MTPRARHARASRSCSSGARCLVTGSVTSSMRDEAALDAYVADLFGKRSTSGISISELTASSALTLSSTSSFSNTSSDASAAAQAAGSQAQVLPVGTSS